MSAPVATTWIPCSACWAVLKLATPATHYETRERRFAFCTDHALPWDLPLGEADGPSEAMVQRAIRIPQEHPRDAR